MTIRTFYDCDGDPSTFRAERRVVGEELYVIFTPFDCGDTERANVEFQQVVREIRAAVLCHLLFWPNDKYLARFVVGELIGTDLEQYHEVQFKDRDDLRYPTWQRMVYSPYLNSREAA